VHKSAKVDIQNKAVKKMLMLLSAALRKAAECEQNFNKTFYVKKVGV